MKNLILFCICALLISASSLSAQAKVKNQKPFKPYWELEASVGGQISGSSSSMERFMNDEGFGGNHTFYYTIFGISWSTTNSYPMIHINPSHFFTFRYQFDPKNGLTANYGVTEESFFIGYNNQQGEFGLQNKLSIASILYTLSTPNQRLKASIGPSFSWMKSSSGGENFSSVDPNPNVSGTLGCKLNLSLAFVRIGPFHLAYYLDANLAGKVKVGPYNTGSGSWSPPDLPISSLNHGLTLGLRIPSGIKQSSSS